MEIKNTEYYLNCSKFFRAPPVAQHTVFGADGLSYIGNDVALAVYRSAKSNYNITVIYDGEAKKYLRNSIPDAMKLCENFVRKLDTVV